MPVSKAEFRPGALRAVDEAVAAGNFLAGLKEDPIDLEKPLGSNEPCGFRRYGMNPDGTPSGEKPAGSNRNRYRFRMLSSRRARSPQTAVRYCTRLSPLFTTGRFAGLSAETRKRIERDSLLSTMGRSR